jgi:hypothetical protein
MRGDQRALHQFEHAVADHAFDFVCFDRTEVEPAQQLVERGAEVFGAVHEGTVEIKDEGPERIETRHLSPYGT